jgi:hypothetical protein
MRMSGRKRNLIRGAAAGATALTLVATGLAAAPFASAAHPGTTLRVAITDHGLYLDGPTTFPAGRVTLYVDAAGGDRGAAVGKLAPGYSFHDLRRDIRILGENLFGPGGDKDKGLKAENRFINHTTAKGGLYAPEGKVRHGTLLLDEPGTYYLFDDSGNIPKRKVALTVTSPSGPQELKSTQGKVKATTNRRFKGDDVLPAHGGITFKNKSTESPHFMSFQHVKDGTTRKDVINSFSSNSQPDFVLKGNQDSDILSSGESMTLRLNLPPGRYALMCFFPDPKTGQPHAFMGMVRMLKLKG